MKAYKLININGEESSFLEGSIAELQHIKADHFFTQARIEQYQLSAHPAPHYQFVITLKGKLEITVSNGGSFIIEPGVILIANDLLGKGHSWKIIEGDVWERIYIVLPEKTEDYFIPK